MSQVEEFVKIVEGVKDHDVKVVIVTGKPGSGKSKVLREAAEEKKWDYIDCRLLITEKFLEVPPGAVSYTHLDVYKRQVLIYVLVVSFEYLVRSLRT